MQAANLIGVLALLALGATAARADLVISGSATQNVSCASGVCTATVQNAVLNVGDLATMLASGDVTVTTAVGAKDVEVQAPLSWASASRLTLDAQRSVILKSGISATGAGGLTITTNDGHSMTGEFVIVPQRGSVQFWDLNSSLIINGQSYTLVGDIKTLATDIAANPSGFYALAKPYDANVDGTYASSPIGTSLSGTFDGLGNGISNFRMSFSAGVTLVFGLFIQVSNTGVIRHARLLEMSISGHGTPAVVGGLVGGNDGRIERSEVRGKLTLTGGGNQGIGALAGANGGVIAQSFADAKIMESAGTNIHLGGLVGFNDGTISESYSSGVVNVSSSEEVVAGGLVGGSTGQIENVFSRTSVYDAKHNCCQSYLGELVGRVEDASAVASSYSAGTLRLRKSSNDTLLGGVVGFDAGAALHSTYWDTDKGVSDPADGAGNIRNDPEITGLTTQQLQSGLPAGFDPAIWAEKENTNGGYPYLKALPPK